FNYCHLILIGKGKFFVHQEIAQLLVILHTQRNKTIAILPMTPDQRKYQLVKIHGGNCLVSGRRHLTVVAHFQYERLTFQISALSAFGNFDNRGGFSPWLAENEFVAGYDKLVCCGNKHRSEEHTSEL